MKQPAFQLALLILIAGTIIRASTTLRRIAMLAFVRWKICPADDTIGIQEYYSPCLAQILFRKTGDV